MAKLIDDKLDNSSFLMNMMDKYKFSLIRAKKKKYLKKNNCFKLDERGKEIIIADNLVEFIKDLKPGRYDFNSYFFCIYVLHHGDIYCNK